VEAQLAKLGRTRRAQRGTLVALPADVQAALAWWKDTLLTAHERGRPLFVKPDGYLDIFDGITFPNPWAVPLDIGAFALLVITIDASASGMGFVVGDPDHPCFAYACRWSVSQAINTPNWRESKAIALALLILMKERPTWVRRGVAILVRSDNVSAVSLVNKESSSSDSLHKVGGEIVQAVATLGCSIAAAHIPGVSNTVADTLSRLAEGLYAQRTLSKVGRRWIAARLAGYGWPAFVCTGVAVGGRSTPPPAGSGGAVCSIPVPACFDAGIKAARLTFQKGCHAAVLLPLSPARAPSHRWGRLLRRYGYECIAGTDAGEMSFFQEATLDVSAEARHAPLFVLETSPALWLWVARLRRGGQEA
jgi:hypothetical protein